MDASTAVAPIAPLGAPTDGSLAETRSARGCLALHTVVGCISWVTAFLGEKGTSQVDSRPGVLDVYSGCMSRTNIEIDDELIAQVMRRYGVATKKQAVDLALRRLVGVPLSAEFLLSLEGVGWDVDLEDIRRDRPSEFR